MAEITLHTKYDIGEKVYFILYSPITIPCPACNQTGVIVYDEHEFKCSACRGTKLCVLNKSTWSVSGQGVVSRFDIIVSEDGERYVYQIEKDGYKWWCNEPDLFNTLEEAQSECDRRNK